MSVLDELRDIFGTVCSIAEIRSPADDALIAYAVEFPRLPDAEQSLAIIYLIAEDAQHLHWGTEEYYVFISGTGRMIVGETIRDVGPGQSIWVPTGTFHATVPDSIGSPLVFAVMSEPAFRPDDFVPHPDKVQGWS